VSADGRDARREELGVHQQPRVDRDRLSVAEVLVGLATDTTVYLSWRGGSLKVNTLTFTIRASDSSWHPGLPGPSAVGSISSSPGLIAIACAAVPRRARI